MLGVPSGDDACGHHRALTAQWDKTDACIGVALGNTFGEHRHSGPRRDRQQDPLDVTVWHLDQRRRNAGGATRREDSVIERPIGIPGKHDDALWGDLRQIHVGFHGMLVTDREDRDGSLLAQRCHANSGRRDGQ
jgi:hypothetical protein